MTVSLARYFVEKSDRLEYHLSASTIEKTWSRYVESAPYIYGFYSAMNLKGHDDKLSRKRRIKTDKDWIAHVTRLAESAKAEDSIGKAAFAAHVLTSIDTRVVRTDDFSFVDRVSPPRREFDSDEEAIIGSFDPKAPLRE